MEEQDKKKKNIENVKAWRLNNTEKYNEYQRNYFKKKMENEDERKKFNERCRINSKRLREQKNNGQQKPKKTPGTDCSMFKDKCDYNDCVGYWCQFTQGGNNNCDSNECTLGKWDEQGNLGFDGQDINRQYFIEFLKHVREYRELKNIKCEICMYASIGYGGDSGNYTSGIDKSLIDFWLDPVTKQPIADMMLSMPAGGTIDPQGPVNTYSHTSEAVSNCLIKEDFGWPKNTGLVGNFKCLSEDLNCINSGNLCRDDRQYFKIYTIELIKATPETSLNKTRENDTHCYIIKGLTTISNYTSQG
jgi:hypothetical protein